MLIPKQMLQRFPMALAQVKTSNTSKKLTKWNKRNHLFFYSFIEQNKLKENDITILKIK